MQGAGERGLDEATALVWAILDTMGRGPSTAHRGLPRFARFPRLSSRSKRAQRLVSAVADFVLPLAARQFIALKVAPTPRCLRWSSIATPAVTAVLNYCRTGSRRYRRAVPPLTTACLDDTVELAVSDIRDPDSPIIRSPASLAFLHHPLPFVAGARLSICAISSRSTAADPLSSDAALGHLSRMPADPEARGMRSPPVPLATLAGGPTTTPRAPEPRAPPDPRGLRGGAVPRRSRRARAAAGRAE